MSRLDRPYFLTTDEKDALMVEATRAYIRCYGEPEGKSEAQERYYVQKGMEAYSAVVHDLYQQKIQEEFR